VLSTVQLVLDNPASKFSDIVAALLKFNGLTAQKAAELFHNPSQPPLDASHPAQWARQARRWVHRICEHAVGKGEQAVMDCMARAKLYTRLNPEAKDFVNTRKSGFLLTVRFLPSQVCR